MLNFALTSDADVHSVYFNAPFIFIFTVETAVMALESKYWSMEQSDRVLLFWNALFSLVINYRVKCVSSLSGDNSVKVLKT